MDPCGVLCVLMVYVFMGYADYVIIFWLIIPIFGGSIWSIIHITTFNVLLGLTMLAHARAMLADPGVVPINRQPTRGRRHAGGTSSDEEDSFDEGDAMFTRGAGYAGDDWTMCTRCETFRPPRAHHCRVCKRCIRKMDHHCPWVNNCVGEYNQKYFLQFLFYVGMCSLHSAFLIIISWVYDDPHASTGIKGPLGENAHHAKVLHTIFLSMESILFGMFVLAVSCDQLNAIFTEETAVEAVQRRGRKQYRRSGRKGKIALLREVCGRGPVWSWFFPCTKSPTSREVLSHPREVNHFDV